MPARLPTSIKIARGTARKDRLKNEPQPESGDVVAPSWLSAEALKVWTEFAPICEQMGTLTPADVNPMARYCELLVQWRQCQKTINEQGMTCEIRGDDGGVKCIVQRPEVGIANRVAVQLRALEGDLGLSALARGKIDLKNQGKTKPGLSASARDRGGVPRRNHDMGKERFFD